VHTPEFDHERDKRRVRAEAARHGLDFPHLIDNDMAYGARSTTSTGRRSTSSTSAAASASSTRARSTNAKQSGRSLESRIQELLAEDASCGGGKK
jgi:hypothetical protein